MSLLVSPIVGFVCAGGLLLLCKLLIKRKDLYMAPEKDNAPPLWIRGLLILTCTGVSYGHGSNDGQKGMGLIMLILVGILPLSFAVDLSTSPASDQGTGGDHPDHLISNGPPFARRGHGRRSDCGR